MSNSGDPEDSAGPTGSTGQTQAERTRAGSLVRSRVGRGTIAALAIIAVLLAVDGVRAPKDQWGARLALVAIDGYQASASPMLGRLGVSCRFEPTCSHFGAAAIRHRGLVPGGWLAVKRVARCGPWTEAGTVDPPPGP